MLTGELGFTWTGAKACRWHALFTMGSAIDQDEYTLEWIFEVADLGSYSGIEYVTSGQNFKVNDVTLSPRFRVDRIANIESYDATFQGLGTPGSDALRLALPRLRVRPV